MTAASDKMHVLAAPRRNPFADCTTPEAIGVELMATVERINASDIGQSHKTSQTDYFVAMATARINELTCVEPVRPSADPAAYDARRASGEWLLGTDGIGPVVVRTPGGDTACADELANRTALYAAALAAEIEG